MAKARQPPVAATPTRGRGRLRASSPMVVPAIVVPNKRPGHPAKAVAPAEEEVVEAPKSGRPRARKGEAGRGTRSSPRVSKTVPIAAPAPIVKRRGRAPKKELTPEPPAPITKRRGRPPKAASDEAPVDASPPAVKRRGRPPKVASNGPARANESPVETSAPAIKRRGRPQPPQPKAAVKAVTAPRINARIRSKLRDRQQLLDAKNVAAAQAEIAVPARRAPAKRRVARPRKEDAAPVAKPTERKVASKVITKKRAPKGYVTLPPVPRKFAAQLQQYLLELEAAAEAGDAQVDVAEEDNVNGIDGEEEDEVDGINGQEDENGKEVDGFDDEQANEVDEEVNGTHEDDVNGEQELSHERRPEATHEDAIVGAQQDNEYASDIFKDAVLDQVVLDSEMRVDYQVAGNSSGEVRVHAERQVQEIIKETFEGYEDHPTGGASDGDQDMTGYSEYASGEVGVAYMG